MSDDNAEALVKYRMEQAQIAIEEAQLLQSAGKSALGVVNRAYYAMFYAVLALLQQHDIAPRKHAGVISLFDSKFVKTDIFPKEYSKNLHQAFKLHQISDYHPVEPISKDEAEELIRNAIEFVNGVNARINE